MLIIWSFGLNLFSAIFLSVLLAKAKTDLLLHFVLMSKCLFCTEKSVLEIIISSCIIHHVFSTTHAAGVGCSAGSAHPLLQEVCVPPLLPFFWFTSCPHLMCFLVQFEGKEKLLQLVRSPQSVAKR